MTTARLRSITSIPPPLLFIARLARHERVLSRQNSLRLNGWANAVTFDLPNRIDRWMGRTGPEAQAWLESQPEYQSGSKAGVVSSMVVPGGGLRALATGLRGASAGLRGLFASGSVRGSSIISIRQTLLSNGFTQGVARNGQGYLFRNGLGEEVRIMSRGGGWDIRIRNAAGNYLDEFGGVARGRAGAHGIGVISR